MKKTYFIITFMLCILHASGQQTPEENINSIKANMDYLYAESRGESWGDTEEAAKSLLLKNITEFLSKNNETADPVSLENIVGNASIIELDTDNAAYIFCYIHIKEISPDYLITDEVIQKESSASTTVRKEKESVKPIKEEPAKPVKKEKEPTSQPLVEAKTPETKKTEKAVTDTQVVFDSKILRQIIQATDPDELNNLLYELKQLHDIMYGKIKYMTAPEQSYILIFDKNRERIAILDKGIQTRTNLITGKKDDSIQNYKGMRAMWFQIFE